MRMNIVEMWCIHAARDNLLYPTTKRTGPMLYKQQLTTRQRISQKSGESKRYVRADILVMDIYHRRLMFVNWRYQIQRKLELG